MNIAYIMRGIPGSGKSTLARELAGDTGVVHSSDDFFMQGERYCFDGRRLGAAHLWNFSRFKQSLASGIPLVVCDSTNVRHEHYLPYVHAAEAAGYQVVIIALAHPDPHVATERNIHGVPLETIQSMMARWEP